MLLENLKYLNSAACFMLMLYSLPVAMLVTHTRMWAQRLSMLAVVFGLFMQFVRPWVTWMPDAAWPTVYLNCTSALMITVWWRSAWLFVRTYLGSEDGDHWMRRVSDYSGSLGGKTFHDQR